MGGGSGRVASVNVTSAWLLEEVGLLRVEGGTKLAFLSCTRYARCQIGEECLR